MFNFVLMAGEAKRGEHGVQRVYLMPPMLWRLCAMIYLPGDNKRTLVVTSGGVFTFTCGMRGPRAAR
jgi:hypothetical protein